jgi:hypothetical protein
MTFTNQTILSHINSEMKILIEVSNCLFQTKLNVFCADMTYI